MPRQQPLVVAVVLWLRGWVSALLFLSAQVRPENGRLRQARGFRSVDGRGGTAVAAAAAAGALNANSPLELDPLTKKGRLSVSPLFRFQEDAEGSRLAETGRAFAHSGSAAFALASAVAERTPSYTGHPYSGYHWEVPFPQRESYPEGAYTLSGGIFESVIEDTCQRMAQRSKSGWCQPPCQMEPDFKRGSSDGTKRDTQSCLVMPYAPGVRADKTGHSLDMSKHSLEIDKKTRDISVGSCPCIDPCSMYKSCSECTANKDAAEMEQSPPWHFTGQDRTKMQKQNTAFSSSPYNCGWCGIQCVSGTREGPFFGLQCSGEWAYSLEACRDSSLWNYQDEEMANAPDFPGM